MLTTEFIEQLARRSIALLVLGLAIFAVLKGDEVGFETELLALAPTDNRSVAKQSAAIQLGADFQSRAVFVLNGSEAHLVEAARAMLVADLSKIQGVWVVDEAMLQSVLPPLLTDYRFHLLSPAQQQLLASGDPQAVLQNRLADRLGLGGTPQILPVAVDPMAWHSLTLVDTLLSLQTKARDVTVSVVSVTLPSKAFDEGYQRQLLGLIEDVTSGVERSFAGVSILEGGLFFHAATAASAAKASVVMISVVSVIGVVLLLLAVFRSILAVLIPVLSVALGIASGFVAAHIAFSGLHVMTLVFGASLIGVVVDYSLHFFVHERLAVKSGSRLRLYRALMLSLVTSIVAYGVLAGSGLAILAQVAVFSGVGLAAALVAVMAFCPLVSHQLSLNDGPIVGVLAQLIIGLRGVPIWLPVGVAFMGLIVILSHYAAIVEEGNDPTQFVPRDTNQLANEFRIDRQIARYEPGRFVFIEGQSADEVYTRTRAFFEKLENDFDLDASQFFSLTRLVPAATAQKDNYQLQRVIYGADGILEQFVEITGLQVDTDELNLAYLKNEKQLLTPSEFVAGLKGIIPPLWFEASDVMMNVVLVPQGADWEAIRSATEMVEGAEMEYVIERSRTGLRDKKATALMLFFPVFAVVAAFLLAVYRRANALLIALIPALSIACVTAFFSLVAWPVTLFHVMAMYLAIGLGLDYGIFVFEFRAHEYLAERAVVVSGLTSLMSFGLLGASGIPVVQGFGLTLLLANAINLLGALWLAAWLGKGEKLFRPSQSTAP